jgi:hypothetical protein
VQRRRSVAEGLLLRFGFGTTFNSVKGERKRWKETLSFFVPHSSVSGYGDFVTSLLSYFPLTSFSFSPGFAVLLSAVPSAFFVLLFLLAGVVCVFLVVAGFVFVALALSSTTSFLPICWTDPASLRRPLFFWFLCGGGGTRLCGRHRSRTHHTVLLTGTLWFAPRKEVLVTEAGATKLCDLFSI